MSDDENRDLNDATDDGAPRAQDGAGGLAPVIPLFQRDGAPRRERSTLRSERPVAPIANPQWDITWTEDVVEAPPGDESEAEARDAAEKLLLKKLRGRSLSEREVRGVLREQGLSDESIEQVVHGFLRHGYLDDLRLAEQLVHIGADRKKQGRQAIAQTLSSRGIPREVIDSVLSESDQGDAERALEFARHKARALASLDREVALRRLVGQLARRGYAGSIAMTAARTALDETGRATVRFE